MFDTETFANEENGDCIPYSVGYYHVSKISKSILITDIIPDEFGKKKAETFVEEGENCIDKLLSQIKKWEGDLKRE